MRTVSIKLLDELTAKAKISPRRRAHFLFHEASDLVQRMVNAMEPGTYIQPHKHENPDKIEAFAILRGKAACLQFDEAGELTNVHLLEENGPELAVDIPPRTYHTFISLQSGTALFEIVQGPYDPQSHKNLAPWAPSEEQVGDYVKKLEDKVRRWQKH